MNSWSIGPTFPFLIEENVQNMVKRFNVRNQITLTTDH